MKSFTLLAVGSVIALGAACGSEPIPVSLRARASAEPAGANCAHGGTRHDVGLDDDGDGQLSPAEIDLTFYTCGADPTDDDSFATAHVGSLFLLTAADVAAAQGYTAVIGNLVISPRAASPATTVDVVLPRLKYVSGNVSDCQQATDTATVQLAALEHVGGGFTLQCSAKLTSVSVPKLTQVLGAFMVSQSPLLTQLTATTLATVFGGITVNNTALTSLSLPAIAYTPAFTTMSFTITNNPNLPECPFAAVFASLRLAGWLGGWNMQGNIPCADAAVACRTASFGADTTTWKECFTKVDYATAKTMCEAQGAGWGLAFLANEAERATAATSFFMNPMIRYWIGYTDAAVEGFFVWDRNAIGSTYLPQGPGGGMWQNGEPNNASVENCAELGKSSSEARANDASCVNALDPPACRYLAAPARIFETFERSVAGWTLNAGGGTAAVDTNPGGTKALHLANPPAVCTFASGSRAVDVPSWAKAMEVSVTSTATSGFLTASVGGWAAGIANPTSGVLKICIDASVAGQAAQSVLFTFAGNGSCAVVPAQDIYFDDLTFTSDMTSCLPVSND